MPTIFPPRDLATKYGRLSKKADDLCNQGEILYKTKPAESKRILRECRRYRSLAKEAKEQEK